MKYLIILTWMITFEIIIHGYTLSFIRGQCIIDSIESKHNGKYLIIEAYSRMYDMKGNYYDDVIISRTTTRDIIQRNVSFYEKHPLDTIIPCCYSYSLDKILTSEKYLNIVYVFRFSQVLLIIIGFL